MKTNKVYIFEVILLGILFVALLVSNKMAQPVLALLIFPYMLVVNKLFQKNQKKSIRSKEVNSILIGFGILYVGLFYLLGFLFYSFDRQLIVFGWKSIIQYIIPSTIVIVSSEIIRNILLNQDDGLKIKGKKIKISKILTFISMVLCDVVVVRGVYNYGTLEGVLNLIGFILCSSIACNLLFDYITEKYGVKGIIAYRLITNLYVYFIPILPNMYVYFRTFLRMVYPYIIYLVLEFGYAKEKYAVSYRERKRNIASIAAILLLTAGITMLISCRFRYGIIVVGSESMTGFVDYGDAAIFESYHGQKISKEDVVVFKSGDIRLIHRVIDIRNINGEIRYYTKGDINEKIDEGYRTEKDIMGVYKLKVKFIGYPTLFVNELFQG